jgi:hypothetical protein
MERSPAKKPSNSSSDPGNIRNKIKIKKNKCGKKKKKKKKLTHLPHTTNSLGKGQLKEIWDAATPNGEDSLLKPNFYLAMRAVALAQNKIPISQMHTEPSRPAPVFPGVPPYIPAVVAPVVPVVAPHHHQQLNHQGPGFGAAQPDFFAAPAPTSDVASIWSVTESKKAEYDSQFDANAVQG